LKAHYRWYIAIVMFLFLLLHQADKLLIGPLTTAIMEDFQINEAQMGAVSSLALIVAAILYPVWGYLYDRYARNKLLSLASLIWGSTTWLSAVVRTYGAFGGAALAPFLAGVIAMRASLHTAILVICVSSWLVCAVLFAVTAWVVPHDIDRLRRTMQGRVEEVARSGA
jgi:MFS family permease